MAGEKRRYFRGFFIIFFAHFLIRRVVVGVAHVLVWVRAAPSLDATRVGRKGRGETVECKWSQRDGWVELVGSGGWMLVHGAAVGLGTLLEPISQEAHLAAAAELAQERARRTRQINTVVERAMEAAPKGSDPAKIRAMVMTRVIGMELTKAHHAVSREAECEAPTHHSRNAETIAAACLPDLKLRGLAIVDDVHIAHDAARRDALSLEHMLRPTVQNLAATRGDHIAWVKQADLTSFPGLAAVLDAQRGLAAALGDWKDEPLTNSPSAMLARYEPGATYKRHRDNSRDAHTGEFLNPRSLTVVYYANATDWSDEDGGHLRFYLGDDGRHGGSDSQAVRACPHLDVAPKGGRFVIFDSFYGHEVRPARRPRFALTFWICAMRQKKSASVCGSQRVYSS